MRNLVYRVGPKTFSSPYSGHGPKFSGSTSYASKHYIIINCLLGFCHIGTPEAPQEVNIGYLWLHHVSYTSVWNQNATQSDITEETSGA